MNDLYNIRKKIRPLFILGAMLPSLCCSIAQAGAAEKTVCPITVDDIYQGNIQREEDGILSYRHLNRKGKSLSSVKADAKKTSDTSKTSSLPSSFDLREKKAVTSIKSQGYSGCCWAFASLKSLESNLIKTKKASPSLDLSESHLSWFLFSPSQTPSDPLYKDGITFRENSTKSAYHAESSTIRNTYSYSTYCNALPYLRGSNALLGTFVLARWSGAVRESAAPFNASTTKSLFRMANAMKQNANALRYQADYYLTDSDCYDGASMDEIKSALMNTGALEASFYSDEEHLTKCSDGTFSYFQNEKNTSYANHCVTIIGWDDNYSRHHFGEQPPSRNGAWLIANSYGTNYGQKGYFWLSYDEPSLGEIYSFQGTENSAYDNNYQYDGSGWGSTLVPHKEHPMKVANIFTANKNYTQSLKAVALYTATADQPYTIKIYKNVAEGNPTSGTLAATLTGTEKYSGYHTISLPKSISLKANERFSVVVSYHQTNEKNGFIPIEGTPLYSSSLEMNFHSTPGKSFCYAYGTNTESGESSYQWMDLHSTPISASGNTEAGIYNNVCIKAFTVNKKKAGSIRFSPSKYKLGAGEKFTLTPIIKNTASKPIAYASSNPSVATVSSNGKIRAKKKGSATITATLSTGATTSVIITVKAAPKKIRTTPARKKTIKVKKRFSIKVKLPANTASYSISYTSSKPRVAKVSKQGKVTGKKKGTAVITVKTFNGKKARIKVKVKKTRSSSRAS